MVLFCIEIEDVEIVNEGIVGGWVGRWWFLCRMRNLRRVFGDLY